MSAWRKICCAVDFADPSWAAMEQAADLARVSEAELTLVHVLGRQPAAAGDVLVSSGEGRAETMRAEELLSRWRADAERRAGRPARSCLLSGHPAEEILRRAREEQCDLLVVGTHGRSGTARLLLGSVAERVARQSSCPVLVVHDHDALERQQIAEEAAQYR